MLDLDLDLFFSFLGRVEYVCYRLSRPVGGRAASFSCAARRESFGIAGAGAGAEERTTGFRGAMLDARMAVVLPVRPLLWNSID